MKESAKVVILGQSSVGKSSIIERLMYSRFLQTKESTIGATFHIWETENDIRLCIWDTAGSERYHSIMPLYYRGAAAAIVAFDVDCRESFVDAKYFIQEIQSRSPRTEIVLVGNKIDKSESGDIPNEIFKNVVNDYISENHIQHYYLVSAKSGENIMGLFENVAVIAKKALAPGLKEDMVDMRRQPQGTGCCLIS